MNLKELNRDRQLSELTGQELCETNRRIDEFFEELFDTMIIEKRDDTIYFTKTENNEPIVYMRQSDDNGGLWVSYSGVWSFFSDNTKIDYTDTQILIQSRVENHFGVNVNTPYSGMEYRYERIYNNIK